MSRSLSGAAFIQSFSAAVILPAVMLSPSPLPAGGALAPEGGFFDVLHYDLSFEVFEDVQRINGSTELIFAAGGDGLDSLVLDLVSLQLDSVRDDDIPLRFRQDKRTVTVFLSEHLDSGDTASVRLWFAGTPGRNRELEAGFYWDQCFMEHPVYMFYGMEPASCRFMFPCRDVINDKATITTEITVNDTLTAVSPGMLVQMETAGGRNTFTWSIMKEMPLYTWGLVISDFYVTEDDEYSWIKYYGFEEYPELVDRIFGDVDLMMDCFREFYGPYPWDHNLNFPFTAAGLFGEHNTMPYVCIPLDTYVAHEISHMWWGNLVTESDWNEIWLAEGMATYSEALWKEWMYGEKFYHIQMGYSMESYLASGENLPMVPAEEYLWSSTTYYKGASVVHMLRHVLGDDAFFEGLRTFLRDNAYGSVNTDDLRCAFETVSGMDLDWFFQQWVYQRGYPDYRISWTSLQDGEAWDIRLCIEQVQTVGPVFRMPVDVLVHGEDEDSLFVHWNDEESDTVAIAVTFRPVSIHLDPDRWILRSIPLIKPKKSPDTID